jgi:galactokinase
MTIDQLARALTSSGLSDEAASSRAARFEILLATLGQARTDRESWEAWYVPGRIEVLGKHTDYGGGRSLICAADRGFSVVAAPRNDTRLSITDIGRGVALHLDPSAHKPDVSWATYPQTVLRRVFHNFPEMARGLDLVFESDLPSAAGMSSSSALMVAVLVALARVNRLESTARWRDNGLYARENLAAYAATIENGSTFRGLVGEAGVGTEGGSEDHTAILCSRPEHLGQFSFVPTRHERYIRFPPDLTFAIGVSGVAARKTGEARDDYNRASRHAARVLERWRERTGRSDGSLAAAIASSPDAAAQLRAWLVDDAALLDRFEQFFEESTQLVPAAGDQLSAGDLDGFGRTVDRSQRLAEDRLRNQVPETVALARAAREHGAIAASAFGAGFGGSVWALVASSDAPAFLDRWQNAYRTAHSSAAPRSRFFLTRPGPAVARLDISGEDSDRRTGA